MSTHLSQSTHMSQFESKCLEEQAAELVGKSEQEELPEMKRNRSADDVDLEQEEQPEKKRKRAADDADLELWKKQARRMAIAEKRRVEMILTNSPDWQQNAKGEWFHVGQ